MKSISYPAYIVLLLVFSSCVTTKKFDAYVSAQYNDQVPEIAVKKKAGNVKVLPAAQTSDKVSATTSHTKTIPLLFYWKIDHRFDCELNKQIGTANFSKAFNTASARSLDKVLNGQQLELTVEQAPSVFSMVDKTNIIWLVLYAVHWSKVYVEPDKKDLVVAYRFTQNDNTVKTGKITVHNKLDNQGLRFFQSWKSATSEHLAAYDQEIIAMTKEFVIKLEDELTQTAATAKE